ncbi:phenylacetate--CoA ligase family protein [Thermodesulfobacteriota bacterium]
MHQIINYIPRKINKSAKYIYKYIPVKYRYGKKFFLKYNKLLESQWWSKHKLESLQFDETKKILIEASKNVPYYSKMFKEYDIKPNSIKNIEDIIKIPYLTKDLIRKNIKELINKNIPTKKHIYVTTSGSTGIPLGFYWEKGRTDINEYPFVWRQWNWAKYYFNDKRVVLRGSLIKNKKTKGLFEYEPQNNSLVMSSYEMTDNNLYKYIKKIEKFKPKAIQAYPSSLMILADFLQRKSLKLQNKIECILTSSENLYDSQREFIESTFNAKIFDHYGNTERNALIMQCEMGNYHIISEYCYTELINRNNMPVRQDGEIGEIVVTGFNNLVMPFIRYKTGDLAVYKRGRCSCGRKFPMIGSIEGRLQELIVSKENRYVSMTAINMHSDVFDDIKQFQFYQDTPGMTIFKIVRKNSYSQEDEINIIKEIKKKIGSDILLKIEYVDNIPRSASGKYSFLEQKLKINYNN